MSAPQRTSDAPSGPPQGLGPVVWRGGVNTWECDEMGHMNVRFYLAKAMEGLPHFQLPQISFERIQQLLAFFFR